MVDALGSRAFIRGKRWRQLREAGVSLVATLNDIPRFGHLALGRVDLRKYRKIVIIDNGIAYCGNQNCADPAFRIKAKYAPWVDIFSRCEGPVVRHAQYLFLCTCIAETGEPLEGLAVAHPAPEHFQPGSIAQMYGTGPTTPGECDIRFLGRRDLRLAQGTRHHDTLFRAGRSRLARFMRRAAQRCRDDDRLS